MRKTIKMLEAQIDNLKQVLEITRIERDRSVELLKFYQTRENFMTTGIIALEKITEVIAHVVSDMRSLRDNPNRERR